jgi:hypothetical protein
MILKNKPALLIGIILCIMGCSINLNPKENRIFVVEEKYIDGVNSFFWFKGTGQITHEGLSYFQIAKDKCDLSFKNANAYCNEALQVYEIKSDTVFILAQSEIKTIKSNEKYKIEAVPYSIELYSISKRPNKELQYFLDSVCKGANK